MGLPISPFVQPAAFKASTTRRPWHPEASPPSNTRTNKENPQRDNRDVPQRDNKKTVCVGPTAQKKNVLFIFEANNDVEADVKSI